MKKYVVILACLACIFLFVRGCRDNERLTVKNIIAVRPGMSMAQVIAILGRPIHVNSTSNSFFYYRCKTQRVRADSVWYSFTYTERGSMIFPYPMLWVNFNERKRVREVYVKRYWLLDDPPLYSIEESHCDTLDPIVQISQWEVVQAATSLMFYFPIE